MRASSHPPLIFSSRNKTTPLPPIHPGFLFLAPVRASIVFNLFFPSLFFSQPLPQNPTTSLTTILRLVLLIKMAFQKKKTFSNPKPNGNVFKCAHTPTGLFLCPSLQIIPDTHTRTKRIALTIQLQTPSPLRNGQGGAVGLPGSQRSNKKNPTKIIEEEGTRRSDLNS